MKNTPSLPLLHPEQEKLSEEENNFVSNISERYEVLSSETSERLERYRTYDDFVEGNQWIRIEQKENDGGERVTHNLCNQVVRKYTSLLIGDMPKLVVPRESEIRPTFDVSTLENPPKENELEAQAPIQFDRSEAIEKILRRDLYENNKFSKTAYDGALNGSKYGDTVFFGYWDKTAKCVKWQNEFPGNVRLSFATNDFRDIEYGFIEKAMSVMEIKRKYGFDAFSEGISLDTWEAKQFTDKPSALVKYYWDRENYAILINNIPIEITKGKRIIKHNYGKVPIFFIPNLLNGKNPWGDSDLKEVITIQESYNKALSDEANLTRMYAQPKLIVYNPGKTDLSNFKSPGKKVIPVSKDARVAPIEFAGQLPPLLNRIERIKRDFYDISGMPEVAYGNVSSSIVTGVAMTALYTPVLQIIRTKATIWDTVLSDMMAFELELYEKFGGKFPKTKLTYKEIIDGWRFVEWQWGSKIPRDDSIYLQNEINKMTTGVQSRSRTMSNIGIDSPQDEMAEIMLEQNNPALNPELAIQKATAEASGGFGGEDQLIAVAEKENEQLAQGQELPSVAKNKKDHLIHLEVHKNFVKNTQGLPQEILDIFDAHMAGHEAAVSRGGGQGGMRVNAGRKEAPPQAEAIPALAATGEMPITAQQV